MTNMRALLPACLVLATSTADATGQATERPVDRYVVESVNGGVTEYIVTGRLHPTESTLRMSEYGAWGQPDGWATFVSELTASDCHERAFEVVKAEKLTWTLADSKIGDVCISYRLDFEGAVSEPWPDGPRTTGIFADEDALFTNTGALFIHADTASAAEVEFRLSPGHEVSTAWSTLGVMRYGVSSINDLVRNAIVIGEHERSTQRVGPLRVHTVMLGSMRPAIGLVDQAVSAVGAEYLAIYPEPSEQDFLFVWFPDGNWETGEAYRSSYAIVSSTIPSEANRLIWANSIAHELQHYWNGHLMSAANWEESQWFVEGFTEYMANLSLVRAGLVSEAQYLGLIRKHLTLFHNFQFRWGTPYERISLVQAGSQKSTNNVAVYDGGWFAALMFDVLMRRASDGAVGVDELMATMVKRFAGATFENEDIVRVAEEISGGDLCEAYAQHVEGRRRMPVAQYLEWAGFQATATPYVVEVEFDPRPGDGALRIRRAMTRGAAR